MPGSAPRPLDEDGVHGAEEGKYPLCSLSLRMPMDPLLNLLVKLPNQYEAIS
jgi:hypothetical protein